MHKIDGGWENYTLDSVHQSQNLWVRLAQAETCAGLSHPCPLSALSQKSFLQRFFTSYLIWMAFHCWFPCTAFLAHIIGYFSLQFKHFSIRAYSLSISSDSSYHCVCSSSNETHLDSCSFCYQLETWPACILKHMQESRCSGHSIY